MIAPEATDIAKTLRRHPDIAWLKDDGYALPSQPFEHAMHKIFTLLVCFFHSRLSF